MKRNSLSTCFQTFNPLGFAELVPPPLYRLVTNVLKKIFKGLKVPAVSDLVLNKFTLGREAAVQQVDTIRV